VKRLIITGDDFGLSRSVNEAIEEAHRRGYLTAASLMVGGGPRQMPWTEQCDLLP
jgi:predicted glycoside hydrolase/deacetylase ChbG (UPF0249 family)